MSNDPKEQKIDWSKVVTAKGSKPSPRMITSLNEGENIVEVEKSSRHYKL